MKRLLASLVLLTLASPALAAPRPNLTLLVDGSLMLPMAELSRLYTKEERTPLTIIRDPGDDPARRLEQGYEAHILLSADPTLVDRLAQRGLIDVFGTQPFASTQLALVAPAAMKKRLSLAKHISFAAILFSQPDAAIHITPPTTPEGLRAQALMDGREFSHELATRAVIAPNHDAQLAALRQQGGFALMLASDAVAEPDLAIMSLLPPETSAPVRYDAVVLASESMEQAREFTRFLAGKEAQAVLRHYGLQAAVK